MRHNKQSADDNLVLQLDDLNRPHHVRNLAQVSHDVPTQLTGFTGGRHMSHSSHEDKTGRQEAVPVESQNTGRIPKIKWIRLI
jgi:hypothetical protein